MKILHRTRLAVVAIVSVLVCGALSAATLDSDTDCDLLGGHWEPAAVGSGMLGTCEFWNSLTVPAGTTLAIGLVDALIPPNRTVVVDGRLEMVARSVLTVDDGNLEINGQMYIGNDAKLTLAKGSVHNNGDLLVEGDIFNGPGSGTVFAWGIFNAGLIHVIKGGNFFNDGWYFDQSATSTAPVSLRIDSGGKFYNRRGAEFNPRAAVVYGELYSDAGSLLKLRRRLTIANMGSFENYGQIIMWSENGRLIVDEGGRFELLNGSSLSNEGSTVVVQGQLRIYFASLHNYPAGPNYGPGRIETYSPGVLSVDVRGTLINDAGAQLANRGTVLRNCFGVVKDIGGITFNPVMNAPCFKPPFKQAPAINWGF